MSKIQVVSLKNSNGMELQISNLGATIIGLFVPDKNGKSTNVIVSLEPEEYEKKYYVDEGLYLGATVGRFAGRISNGSFKIDGKNYPLHNQDGVHLHGGKIGFDKKYWDVKNLEEGKNPSVEFICTSEHLEEGYPGNLKVSAKYQLTEKNEVIITYSATSDAKTVINLTNHSYFNLNGKDSILNHELMINSNGYLDVDDRLIPSGKLNDSKNTRFDCNKNSAINRDDFLGFDNAFVLGESDLKASLNSVETGIKMDVFTNQPACVVYTPEKFPNWNFKSENSYSKFSAICFETQGFPDAPNHSNFPSCMLNPEEKYVNKTVFEFSF